MATVDAALSDPAAQAGSLSILESQGQSDAEGDQYVGREWSPANVLSATALERPTQVTFTKNTLKRLFGWKHGSSKRVVPTVIFRHTPEGSSQPVQLLGPVELLPPSRDDDDVASLKREGMKRAKVDGYGVPQVALKTILQALFANCSPEGCQLRFVSGGWQGKHIVVDVCHIAAAPAPAAAPPAAAPPAAAVATAAGSAAWETLLESSACTDAVAADGAAWEVLLESSACTDALAADGAAGGVALTAAASRAGELRQAGHLAQGSQVPAAQQPAAQQPAAQQPQPSQQPAMPAPAALPRASSLPELLHSLEPLGLRSLVLAAEADAKADAAARSSAPAGVAPARPVVVTRGSAQPLHACLGSMHPDAQEIVRTAKLSWLPTEQVHKLMANHTSLGVPITMQQPYKPQGGDLFLTDLGRRFDRSDGYTWVDRRATKLKLERRGEHVMQVVYHTSEDKKLKRRAYHFLKGSRDELGLQLLHYQPADDDEAVGGISKPVREALAKLAFKPKQVPKKLLGDLQHLQQQLLQSPRPEQQAPSSGRQAQQQQVPSSQQSGSQRALQPGEQHRQQEQQGGLPPAVQQAQQARQAPLREGLEGSRQLQPPAAGTASSSSSDRSQPSGRQQGGLGQHGSQSCPRPLGVELADACALETDEAPGSPHQFLQEEETAAEEDEVEQEEAASLPPLPQQLPPCPGPQQQRAQAQQRRAQWPSAVAPVPAMAAARPPAQRAAASSAQQPLQAITKVAAQRPGQAAADVAAAGQQSLAQEAPPAAVVRQLARQGAAAAAAAATAKQQQQQQQQVQARRPPSQQQEEQRAEPAAAPATQQHYPSPQQLAVPPPVLTPTPWSSQKRPRNQSAASAEPQGSKRQTAPFSVTPTLFNAMAQQAVRQQLSQSAGAVLAVLNPDLSDAARSRAERVWAECQQIVNVLLLDQRACIYFGEPATWVPTYYEVVKQPMDLGTVQRKLSATTREYSTPYQFRDDVRLVFNNCRLFNPPGNHVRMVGDEASARFETEWTAAQVEARWEAHLRLCEQEDQQRQAAAAKQLLVRRQQQQAAGLRASRPAATTSAQAAGAAAAEAAAAAAAAEGEAAAAATLSPQARLAQRLTGSGEWMYTGIFDLPDLDGKQQAAGSASAGRQQQRATPAAGRPQAAAPSAAAGAAWKEGDAGGLASESEAEELEIDGGPAAQQAQHAAAEQTAAQRQQQEAAVAEWRAAERRQQEAAEAERQAAEQRQQEAAAAAEEERQRQAAAETERQRQQAAKAAQQQREAAEAERQQKAAEEERLKQQAAEAERQRQQREAAEAERQRQQREAAEAERQRQQREAAEAERQRQQREAAEAERRRQQREAAEAERQRQQREAAEAERQRQQREAAEAERRRQQQQRQQAQQQQAAAEQRQRQQAADEERQRQEASQQQQQQHGQKREREEAAEGSEAPPGAKRPATAAESQGQQQAHPQAAKEEQAAVKLEPGASGAVDRFAAVRVAMPILRRAGVTGATYVRFLNEYLKKNSDDAEVALAVELLQECDAVGDSDAVRTLVESYLPQ